MPDKLAQYARKTLPSSSPKNDWSQYLRTDWSQYLRTDSSDTEQTPAAPLTWQDKVDAKIAEFSRLRTPEDIRAQTKGALIQTPQWAQTADRLFEDVGRTAVGDLASSAVHPLKTIKGVYDIGKEVVTHPPPLFTGNPLTTEGRAKNDAAMKAWRAENNGPISDQVHEFQKDYARDPKGAVAKLTGHLLAMYVEGKLLDAVGKPIKPLVVGMKRYALENLTGTTSKITKDLVKDTKAANAEATVNAKNTNEKSALAHQAAVQDALHETQGREIQHAAATKEAEAANAKAIREHEQAVELVDATNDAKMKNHAEKSQSVEEENAAQQAEYESAKTEAEKIEKMAKEKETRRGELARNIQQQSARLVERIKSVQAKWKDSTALQRAKGYQPTGILDKGFDQLRKANAKSQGSSADLAAAVKKAEQKITGSSENVKIFKDILSKNPSTNPPTWTDLQGYYTELGKSLSGGGLPSDIYQAMRSLQGDIANQMQGMANSNGVGTLWRQLRAQYRDYMQTFEEGTGANHSGSPIAQALNAKDPTYAVKPLGAKEVAQRIRNDLSRFDPVVGGVGGAAKLFDNFTNANRELDSLGKPTKVSDIPVAPVPKEAPNAPNLQARPTPPNPVTVAPPERVPVPDRPVEAIPEIKKIGSEEIQQAKEEALRKHTAKIRSSLDKAALYITGYRTLVSVGRALTGDAHALSQLPPDIGEGIALAAGGHGLTMLLESPKVVRYLTKPTAADLAAITPDIAGDLEPIVESAKKQGLKVSSALAAAITAAQHPSPKELLEKAKQLNPTGDPQSSVATPKELLDRAKQLNPAAQGQVSYNHVAVNPDNGHRIGSHSGQEWFDIETGAKVA